MEENNTKEVYFHEYCHKCIHEKLNEAEDICNECLNEPKNENSHKPVNFTPKE